MRVISMDAIPVIGDMEVGNDHLLGIVFPTHGFTAPWRVLKDVCKLPAGRSTHALVVAARAGMKAGRFHVPGISGSAVFIIGLILLLKGYRTRGFMSVDMPSNWYSLHPIQKPVTHEAIISRAEQRVETFMTRILSNESVYLTSNNLYELTLGLLLFPVSLAYLFMGRFFLAKLFFANRNCDGCGVCARHCPVGAIRMWGKRNPRPFWKYSCESCMRCAAFCPQNAIEAGHSWGVLLFFATGVPVSAYLLSGLGDPIFGVQQLEKHLAGEIIDFLYYYPALFVSYYAFAVLIRIPAVNWLFAHTTLTHLPFWGRYREPNTRLKSIAPQSQGREDGRLIPRSQR